MSRRQTRSGLGLLLLGSQVMQIGVHHIPPVTLATLVFNVAVYLQLFPFMSDVKKACTSNFNVFHRREWQRLIYSSFFHLDDMHLYFNMVSFIWKGRTLERQMKGRKFFILLACFSILTQVVMLGLNSMLSIVFSNDTYLHNCAAGFSAVIFSLKVLTTHYSSDNVTVMGLPIVVPSRYACWVELILIQIMVPNVSFTGHLAGILVGLMYVYGPLKHIVKGFNKILKGKYLTQGYQQSYEFRSTPTGNNEDEDLQRAIRNSLQDRNFHRTSSFHSTINSQYQSPPPYGWNLGYSSSTQPTAPSSFKDFNDSDSLAPYPPNEHGFTEAFLPYPIQNSFQQNDFSSGSFTTDTDTSSSNINVRFARLKKFEKRKY